MEDRMFDSNDLKKIRLPMIDHIHLGYKIVKCKKCETVKKLKEIEGSGKCPKCGTTYPKDNRGISFYTQATNHFVVPDMVNKAGYGERPIQLHVAFPTNKEDLILRSGYYVYDGRQNCICRREIFPIEKTTASRAVPIYQVVDDKYKPIGQPTLNKKEAADKAKTKSGLKVTTYYQTRQDIPCLKENCEYFKKGDCHFVTTFDFFLSRVPQMGIWRISTGSINSTKNLIAGLSMIMHFFGSLSSAEFLLDVVPEVKTIDGKFKKTIYVLRLSYEENLKQIIESRKAKLFALPAPAAMLTPPLEPGVEVVIDAPENDVPEDLISKHVEDGEVIMETPTKSAPPPSGGGTASSSGGAGGPAAGAGNVIDKDKILKELKEIIGDDENDIGQEDIIPIYKKLGIPKGTLVSKISTDKLPLFLDEIRKLVKEPARDEKPGKGKKLF